VSGAAYGGDHVDMRGRVFDGPVTGKVVLPHVPEGAEKVTVTFQGPQDGSAVRHWAPEPPSDYEIRREALRAAAVVTSSGVGTGVATQTLRFAHEFEVYLRGPQH